MHPNDQSKTVSQKRSRAAFPARLHVLLAREAEVGLVIRRGPSRSVCIVSWDRRRDTFRVGQWMRGRIYERRCDLSPDGKHLIYFAMNGRWKGQAKGAWTAISRAPYLKALDLFAKGDCWHGGGLFLSDRSFWRNDGYGHEEIKKTSKLNHLPVGQPKAYFGGECPNVYYNRLIRDGWTMREDIAGDATVFEKAIPKGWTLRKYALAEIGAPPGRGCYWDAHELRREESREVLAFPEWEWADQVDGRLVFACEGQLRTARLSRGRLVGETVLHDFNDMQFEALVAPY